MSLHQSVPRRIAANVPRYPYRYVADYSKLGRAIRGFCDFEAASRLCFGLGVFLFRSSPHYVPIGPQKLGYGPWPSRTLYLSLLRQECERLKVSYQSAKGHSKARKPAIARMLVWKELRRMGYSLPGIGAVCFKDHSSVLSGLRRLQLLDSITQFALVLRK